MEHRQKITGISNVIYLREQIQFQFMVVSLINCIFAKSVRLCYRIYP
jgi:hypothetical protein